LQRLFADYVGIGPKWVIRRFRLHEVTERLAAGADIDWAALAAELGYADQAHFVRDFRAMFGEPPTWYAERY
jgi:AraC-like DNA-binding protein